MSAPAKKSTRSKRRKTVARENAPHRTGRPPLDIDRETVEGMAAVGATKEDVAAFLEVSRDTIERHFAALFEKHKAGRRIKLQQAQLRTALGSPRRVVVDGKKTRIIPAVPGNPTMQIWLGKQLLGQSEKLQVPVDGEGEEVERQYIEILGQRVIF